MSFDLNPLETQEETPFWTIKDTLGLIVLGIGVFIGLWVFIQVWHLISDPGSMGALRELISSDLGFRYSGPGEGSDLAVPREIFAYMIVIFLLMIALGVAKAFVTGGVNIMAGDWQRLVKKKFEGFEVRLKEIGDSIKSQFPK